MDPLAGQFWPWHPWFSWSLLFCIMSGGYNNNPFVYCVTKSKPSRQHAHLHNMWRNTPLETISKVKLIFSCNQSLFLILFMAGMFSAILLNAITCCHFLFMYYFLLAVEEYAIHILYWNCLPMHKGLTCDVIKYLYLLMYIYIYISKCYISIYVAVYCSLSYQSFNVYTNANQTIPAAVVSQ